MKIQVRFENCGLKGLALSDGFLKDELGASVG